MEIINPRPLFESYSAEFKQAFGEIQIQLINAIKTRQICKIKADILPKILVMCNSDDYFNTVTFIKSNNMFGQMDTFSSVTILLLQTVSEPNTMLLKNVSDNDFYLFDSNMYDEQGVLNAANEIRIEPNFKPN